MDQAKALLDVAIIQTDLIWEQPETNRQQLAQLLRGVNRPVDLIVLPEMFVTGFSMSVDRLAEPPDGPSVQWMRNIARLHDALVVGSLIVTEQRKFYNRFVAMSPDGVVGHYDKRHRFSLANEHMHYTAGTANQVIRWRGWRILPQICYDLRFPVWSRHGPDQEYELVVYVANWPEPRSHHWRHLLPARAIENQSYCIGVNRVGHDGKNHPHRGDSLVLDFHGEPLAQLPPHAQGIAYAQLDMNALNIYRSKFPFQSDADRFTVME